MLRCLLHMHSTSRTIQAFFAHFLVILSFIAHLRTMLSNPGTSSCAQFSLSLSPSFPPSLLSSINTFFPYTGYVPLPSTKIDFSSDLERPDPNQKKKKKVESCTPLLKCTCKMLHITAVIVLILICAKFCNGFPHHPFYTQSSNHRIQSSLPQGVSCDVLYYSSGATPH